MFRIICAINDKILDEIRVINTGHVNDKGEYLYRIKIPAGYDDLEIYHNRDKSWHFLAEKVFKILNEQGYNFNDEILLNMLMEIEGF